MRARWLAPLIVIVPLLVQAPASALSCVPLSEQKPYSSFAGTIVQQRGDAYLLVVREVWSGPDLPERTWIKFDEFWPDPVPAVGQAWVVFADESWRANTCTAMPGSGVDDLRPSKVRKPTPATWWSEVRTSLIATSMLVAPNPDVDETD